MDTLHPGIAAKESDDGRNEYKVFGNDHGSAHVYFQVGIFETSGGVQSKPVWIKGGATR